MRPARRSALLPQKLERDREGRAIWGTRGRGHGEAAGKGGECGERWCGRGGREGGAAGEADAAEEGAVELCGGEADVAGAAAGEAVEDEYGGAVRRGVLLGTGVFGLPYDAERMSYDGRLKMESGRWMDIP